MKTIRQMRIEPDSQASKIIREMEAAGVLGAGRMAKATALLREMFSNPDYTVFLALAGPVVPGGLRGVVSDLVRRGLVEAIVSNGANITHDIIEAVGFRHLKGDIAPDDAKLKRERKGRVGDILVEMAAFKGLEKKVHRLLDLERDLGKAPIPLHKLLASFGGRLDDEGSILVNAARRGVPVFSPGILDSMLGLHLWTYSQLKGLKLDLFADMGAMADLVFSAKKMGVVILGGGLPKHFTLGAAMLRGGVEGAIQITMDRPEAGSLSGAPLEEAISWGKAKVKSRLVTVIGDFTVLFPLMVSAALGPRPYPSN